MCLSEPAALERLRAARPELEPYSDRIVVAVLFQVSTRRVDGRGDGVFRKSRLGKIVSNSQILSHLGLDHAVRNLRTVTTH